jgi:hypothetical protein
MEQVEMDIKMKKKLLLVVILIMTLAGCGKTVSYKYNETASQNGDWSVDSGKISLRDGKDSFKFKVKYEGETLISEGKLWNCKVMVREKNKETSLDDAKVLFTRTDIDGKEIAKGDIKVVDTDHDVIDIENDYDFSTIYLSIEYSKENETVELRIRIS